MVALIIYSVYISGLIIIPLIMTYMDGKYMARNKNQFQVDAYAFGVFLWPIAVPIYL